MTTPAHGALTVTTPGHQYEIVIGRGLLTDASAWRGLPKASHAVIVTNPTVGALYTAALQAALAGCYARVSVLELPDGTKVATVISWEVFFGGRANEGVEHGGEFIINPTNGSSYTWTVLQCQQVVHMQPVVVGRAGQGDGGAATMQLQLGWAAGSDGGGVRWIHATQDRKSVV